MPVYHRRFPVRRATVTVGGFGRLAAVGRVGVAHLGHEVIEVLLAVARTPAQHLVGRHAVDVAGRCVPVELAVVAHHGSRQVSGVQKKLGFRIRQHMVVWAIRAGVVDDVSA